MLSRPNRSARAVNATSRRTANRTRISAVVSWSRSSTCPRRIDRAAPDTARPVTTTSPANAPSTTTFEPVLPPEEKNNDSNTIAAKSAMLAAASALCPTSLSTCPASLSTGTTRPSEVAENGVAEQPPPEAMHVDLQPGEEQQERQAEQGEDLHRQVDVHPAEHRRPDDDAADDLEHDRRDAQP